MPTRKKKRVEAEAPRGLEGSGETMPAYIESLPGAPVIWTTSPSPGFFLRIREER